MSKGKVLWAWDASTGTADPEPEEDLFDYGSGTAFGASGNCYIRDAQEEDMEAPYCLHPEYFGESLVWALRGLGLEDAQSASVCEDADSLVVTVGERTCVYTRLPNSADSLLTALYFFRPDFPSPDRGDPECWRFDPEDYARALKLHRDGRLDCAIALHGRVNDALRTEAERLCAESGRSWDECYEDWEEPLFEDWETQVWCAALAGAALNADHERDMYLSLAVALIREQGYPGARHGPRAGTPAFDDLVPIARGPGR